MRNEILRCDGPDCFQHIEAAVEEGAHLSVPESWFTLSQRGQHDLLFHALACVHAYAAPQPPIAPPTVPLREPARSEAKARKREAHESH